MANAHLPGPLGTHAEGVDQLRPLDEAGVADGCFAPRGPVNETGLTAEQRALALDIAQLTLDIVGIFEPTPFADGTNALISIGRGDWWGAGLSGISMIPYLGDLAKAGKLPKYSQKLYDAIQLARNNAEFAKLLRPALEKLKQVVDSIPTGLSQELAAMVDQIKRPLDSYLGMAKAAERLTLTQRLILARLGSLSNVGELVVRNIEMAQQYFVRHGVPEEKMVDALRGIDLHSPVEVVQFRKGDVLSTSVTLPPGVNAADLDTVVPGEWFVKAGGGVGKESVGVAHGARQTVHFEVNETITVLKSKAASVDDFWTDAMQRRMGHSPLPSGPGTRRVPKTVLDYDAVTGQVKIRSATTPPELNLGVGARGGGTQYYFPKSAQSADGRMLTRISTRVLKHADDGMSQEHMSIDNGSGVVNHTLAPEDYTIEPSKNPADEP